MNEYFRRAPIALYEVESFLEELLGEQFEATLGCKADSEDYKYVADVIQEETQELNPVPINVARALEWLREQMVRLNNAEALLSGASAPPTNAVEELSLDSAEPTKPLVVQSVTETSRKLSIRQVALLHIYRGSAAIINDAKQVALDAGYKKPTSGQQLKGHYNKLSRQISNRIGVEGKASTDMAKDISKVIPYLTGAAQQQAERELQTIKAKS
ncbi:hypothetical protein [Hymenobacter sp. PAMC 26628]|uniref:hypothetical protein n=1 Tax=Hymenobacter sp. PAMC 26628 TaxID=1484118 RepID=UPI0012FFB6C1|nr:hypothetical protein [Hymenobacter sp. PAMC 26628]